MNLIEEAAKRLQELEKAGIGAPPPLPRKNEASAVRIDPLPELVARAAEARERAEPRRESTFIHIDLARLQADGFITPGMRESRLMHEFRVIKRPLIQNALSKGVPVTNRNLIMVTSALPGEGKTFVAVNLAMSIAMEVDCTVLLVDADVVAPTIPATLGVQKAKGLMDVLTDPSIALGTVLQRTNIERLSVLQAGTPQRGASELLASDGMTRLLNDLSSRYPDRIVVFDSPPLLATRMGQVLMVVEAERTTHGVLESALATVESCPLVLTMLNKAPESDAGSYYGYYGVAQ
jgi:receptor protein-tyrosine kinase